jgi:hypothetical protein
VMNRVKDFASSLRHINWAYGLLLVVGVAFSITACCYFVLALRDVRSVEMRNSAGPARSALMDFIDAHGVKLMTGEIALLAVLTVTAIATDRK